MEYRHIKFDDNKSVSSFLVFMDWIAKRQSIFWKRVHGEDPPWTKDSILSQYKFTNVYRVLDRSTQFMLKNVIYDSSWNEEDIIFRVMLYKFFNLPNTWMQLIEDLDDDISVDTFDKEEYKEILDIMTNYGGAIYSNAYMMTGAKSYGSDIKHHNHMEMFDMFFKSGKIPFVKEIMKSKSLDQLYKNLLRAKYVGPFLAMQLATDLNYSPLFDFDQDSFVIAGPGAVRGLQKLYEEIPKGTKYEDLLEDVMHDFDSHYNRVQFIPLKADNGNTILPSIMDIQNCMCEFDKYMRVFAPHVVTSGVNARQRIKNTFKPTGKIEEPFLPPKWSN